MDELVAADALRQGKRLAVRYHGHARVVEVHAVGVTGEGHGVLRVWQVRGGSNSGKPVGWKLLRLDAVLDANIVEEKSQAPRPGYRRGDSLMRSISAQL